MHSQKNVGLQLLNKLQANHAAPDWPYPMSKDRGLRGLLFGHNIEKGPERYLCRIKPGVVAKVFVTIEVRTWKDIEFLIKEQLPKIVIGWEKERYIAPGNPFLDATDLVSGVGTPLKYSELRQNNRYSGTVSFTKRLCEPEKPYAGINFGFSVAYSKRGLAGKWGKCSNLEKQSVQIAF